MKAEQLGVRNVIETETDRLVLDFRQHSIPHCVDLE